MTSMTEILSSEIIGRTAMTPGGYPMGRIDEIVVDTKTGEIKYLLIKANANSATSQKIDAKGRSVVSFNTLKISGDNVIIS